ncbi:unnamed protein product [Heligmosomoides polygyrus]|uniref:FH2 domain-containing protein n=1 Tax=Heligmosomoides polygyrus TaxID=6339 RepID=A0A183G3G1_HELPZ|nr:unnamed protein product [Heligmosomoides polygyrus]
MYHCRNYATSVNNCDFFLETSDGSSQQASDSFTNELETRLLSPSADRLGAVLSETEGKLRLFQNTLREEEALMTEWETQMELMKIRIDGRAPPDYEFVSYEEVTEVLKKFPDDTRGFALSLDRLLFIDEPWIMQIPMKKRLRCTAKIQTIKECIFFHYGVPRSLEKDIWRLACTALDARASRLRKSAAAATRNSFRTSTPTSDFQHGAGYYKGFKDNFI